MVICPNCGKETPHKKFCENCGCYIEEFNCKQVKDTIKNCKYCQSTININATVCPYCKKKQKRTKQKFIIIGLIILMLCIFGIILFKNKEKQLEKLYITNSITFYDSILNNGIILEEIGNDITKYWHDYIYEQKYDSIESAVKQALEDNKEYISTIEVTNDFIYNMYSKLLKLPNKKHQFIEIQNEIKNLYSCYNKLYLLIISPNGSYLEFKEHFSNYDNELSESINNLKILIDISNK